MATTLTRHVVATFSLLYVHRTPTTFLVVQCLHHLLLLLGALSLVFDLQTVTTMFCTAESAASRVEYGDELAFAVRGFTALYLWIFMEKLHPLEFSILVCIFCRQLSKWLTSFVYL